MTEQSALLDVVLRPAPPMSPRALSIILGIVVALNAAFATYFVSHGAWPMMPFMGVDIVLLAWAFRASTRAAKREEHVVLTPSSLNIARKSPEGVVSEVAFNPYWVRVDIADPPEHASQLTLWSHGRGVRIGSFLPPMERASFAERLKSALRLARATPV
ncbi:MAG TPA: DUF2244 domain-containing protein [Rhizomicrobium sp.]|jgi:uncharacterized membrane protein|nr:DUF2244 domain-containing protein [Rhizomicrobium sp.]